MILAIDPGVHHHGLALFLDDGRLFRCALMPGPGGRRVPLAVAAAGLAVRTKNWADAWWGGVVVPARIVAELPQDRGQARVPPADLIALSVVLGWTLGALGEPATLISPSEWKGSTPKAQHQPRIIAALSAEEAAMIPSGALAHNVIDAVGIGLWAVGRISGGRKRGVFTKG